MLKHSPCNSRPRINSQILKYQNKTWLLSKNRIISMLSKNVMSKYIVAVQNILSSYQKSVLKKTLKPIFTARGVLPFFTAAFLWSFYWCILCNNLQLIGSLGLNFTDDMGTTILKVNTRGHWFRGVFERLGGIGHFFSFIYFWFENDNFESLSCMRGLDWTGEATRSIWAFGLNDDGGGGNGKDTVGQPWWCTARWWTISC